MPFYVIDVFGHIRFFVGLFVAGWVFSFLPFLLKWFLENNFSLLGFLQQVSERLRPAWVHYRR
jgi:hypothetical protein